MLRYFTFLSPPEIQDILDSHEEQPEKRQAQTCLARWVTYYIIIIIIVTDTGT